MRRSNGRGNVPEPHDRLAESISFQDFVWAAGNIAHVHRIPFDADLFARQSAPPYSIATLVKGLDHLGLGVTLHAVHPAGLGALKLPCVVLLRRPEATADESCPEARIDQPSDDAHEAIDGSSRIQVALVGAVTDRRIVLVTSDSSQPKTLSPADVEAAFTGIALEAIPRAEPLKDADRAAQRRRPFGFSWFVPELLKYRGVWRDVLAASLVLQLVGLATPLLTQTIVDKVVVHQTASTLVVIGIALAVFTVFGSILSWVRQYLILHTGNRVDAVLGASAFEHVLKLPPRYFEHRPTGVVAARLMGVETIREFIASAAVTLVLDLPFLLVVVAVMFWYSVNLTLIVLAILAAVIVISLIVAPVFRARLDQQFLLGARNQAFVTEYVAGLETVKSLQLEPQLNRRYSGYLATYLHAGFETRQLANTYNCAASALEQLMSILVLCIGAWTVMRSTEFTIGMLVAFQMFANRLSQPMLRLVGLWQQFQQAGIAVRRLGDILDAPPEPYAAKPSRAGAGSGRIDIERLAFRHAEDQPFLFEDLHLSVMPGTSVAIMGPSGCGKSTLAKLLQGYYRPTAGNIALDGTDIRHLAANELRGNFGVVPQETVLFSGTLYDNLVLAQPHATFEQVVQACKMAEMHHVIERLPLGYQTEVGERGAGLSGGQKQRVAIARALIKRPKILIFDEATSNLDSVTAEHFARTINSLKGKVTMLFIAHQLPRLLQVDQVIQIGEQAHPAGKTAAFR
jgi:subfamily B ATP-binding cassette protein HlyB/CyaB